MVDMNKSLELSVWTQGRRSCRIRRENKCRHCHRRRRYTPSEVEYIQNRNLHPQSRVRRVLLLDGVEQQKFCTNAFIFSHSVTRPGVL